MRQSYPGMAVRFAKSRLTRHSSFLVPDRALKLKRAVRFAFLDFSTPERRLRFCEAELALNRRTAPRLYVAVRRITREADGRLALDGAGEPRRRRG